MAGQIWPPIIRRVIHFTQQILVVLAREPRDGLTRTALARFSVARRAFTLIYLHAKRELLSSTPSRVSKALQCADISGDIGQILSARKWMRTRNRFHANVPALVSLD